ncbi:MAG: DUF3341 domain-containing protein [Bacteroidales bacterium]|nr:DUF3341 domain-containing protein [Bacteroidales bacterium]
MKKSINYISAFYEDEEHLIEGIRHLKKHQIEIHDVLTPFPVHGLDKALGLRRSWIPRIGFIGGAIGGLSGFLFQTWIFTEDYPLVIGGKPYFAVPSFIPVTFECTVLFAAFAMVFAFLFRSKLGLGAENKIYDTQVTDNRFLVVAGFDGMKENSLQKVKLALEEANASIIEIKTGEQI